MAKDRDGEIDIAVLELLEAAPAELPRYQLYAGRGEIGKTIVLTGYGATGLGDAGVTEVPADATVKRAGLNRLEAFFDDRHVEIGYDFDSGDGEHNTLSFLGHESDLGIGSDEALTTLGDSGGPIFSGQAILGVTAFNVSRNASDFNDEFDQSWGEAAFATRVSSFQDFILEATDGKAVFVPEPSASYLARLLPLLVLLARSAQQRALPRDPFVSKAESHAGSPHHFGGGMMH